MKAIPYNLERVNVSTDERHYLVWLAGADRRGLPFDRETSNCFCEVICVVCMDILEQLGEHIGKQITRAFGMK